MVTCGVPSGGPSAFGKSRCSSGGEMAMRKYQNCDGIPLEDPPLVDGVMGAIFQ